jgi:uncharacterized protein YdaU (DUF1376 family)
MAEYPAFLFYPEDFTAGTLEMSPTEVGIYIRCLCHQWHKFWVPDDAVKVGRIAGASPAEMSDAWPAVRAKFKDLGNGQLKNGRLEKIRSELKRLKRVRSSAGRAGAESRWGGKSDGSSDGIGNAIAMADASQSKRQKIASRVEDVNVTEDEHESENGTETPFDRFWAFVPNKIAKRSAKKAYDLAVRVIKSRPVEAGPGSDDPHAFLLDRVRAFSASELANGDTQYIPHPATWLNAGQYDDDPATWQRSRRDPRGTRTAAEQFLGGFDG